MVQSHLLTRLLSIRPGEENKTVLLAALHFLFYLGLMWGDKARTTLFLDAWSADDLDLIFIGNALLAFAMGLAYTTLADRISNARLLVIIAGVMILWLISVQILLGTHGGPGGAVFPYFYLVYQAFRDLSTLHILNYINDFYDTRAAKRALPLMLSAGTAGGMLAGLSVPFLEGTLGLENVPLAWISCLVLVIGLVFLIRQRLASELGEIEEIRQASRDEASASRNGLENMRAGFRYVRESGLLRILAIATFAMVVLMNLLIFQSSQIFEAQFEGNRDGLFRFLGIVDGAADAIGLLIQSVILSRLVSLFGVGTMNLFFPSLTLVSVGALSFFPRLSTAILGRLDHTMFKQAFRNPLDAMLYNSVPVQIKGRAKGFVNGLIVPLGTLGAGLILLASRLGWLSAELLIGVGLTVAVVYLIAALQLRSEYSRSLASLLGEDEMAIFRLDQASVEQIDPNTLDLLYRRLRQSQDDEMTVFLAEMIYAFEGREALDRLRELALQRGPKVRAGIIQMLGVDWITDPAVRRLSLDSLNDDNVTVRRAAVMALCSDPKAIQDTVLLDAFLNLLDDPDETVQAGAIPPLIASGDFYYLAPAVQTLSSWLALEASSERRAAGLRVLAKTGAERMVRTLVRYLNDPDPVVRRQAVELIDDLTAQTPLESMKQFGLDTLQGLLADDDESVRLAAVNGLARFRSIEASQVLMVALSDTSFEVRRRACDVMHPKPEEVLETALDSDNNFLAESAAFILARYNHTQARRRAIALMERLVTDAYRLHMQRLPLQRFDTPGVHLLETTLREEADRLLDRVFWLLSALTDEEEAGTIERSLQSEISMTQANAAETLESLTSPQLTRLIVPLFDGTTLSVLTQTGREELDLPHPSEWQIFGRAWPQFELVTPLPPIDQNLATIYKNSWLTALTIYVLSEITEGTAGQHKGYLVNTGGLQTALRTASKDRSPLIRETANLALARLDRPDRDGTVEETMLTTIEKVIFLKEVLFFQGMTIDQLRTIAGISEEAIYGKDEQIIAEGNRGDSLYVIVDGQVTIQRQSQGRRGQVSVTRLATLGPREYFAEMSIFDNEPYSADAVALEPTKLLLVRQAPLVALIKHQPELALDLLKVLSHRLRQANVVIAEKTPAKSKQILDIFDKLE